MTAVESTARGTRTTPSSAPAQSEVSVRFDAQLLAWQHRGGISSYFAHIVAGFQRDAALRIRPVGVPQFTLNEQAIALGMGRALPRPVPRRFQAVRAMNAVPQLMSGVRHHDVVHYTYYANERLHGARNAARVVTVHDMIPELFPHLYPEGNPHEHKLAHVAAADLVLCVSQTTRDDLLSIVPEVEDRVRVTPLGVADDYFRPVAASADETARDRPFVLFVGMRDHYKNLDVVLRAMTGVPEDVDLLLVGGGALTTEERRRIDALDLGDRVSQITPSDDRLRALYRSAVAFVFPSRYEGFGLPALEAMASGCPTLLARTAVFQEIAGDGARYFDPDDHDELTAALMTTLETPTGTASLTDAARARASGFTWARTATATATAYREARDV